MKILAVGLCAMTLAVGCGNENIEHNLASENAKPEGSGCAQRLNDWGKHDAACLIMENGKALMVHVPYGRAPGWDLPGGGRHRGERACEVAERETCEETGYRVRAEYRISSKVFRCRIVSSHGCHRSVDEGFLKKQWFHKDAVRHLHLRGGTWGDKKGIILRTH